MSSHETERVEGGRTMPAAAPSGRVDGLRTAAAAGLSRVRGAFEVVAGGVRKVIAPFARWPRNLGHMRVSGRRHPARVSGTTAPSFRSIGEAVRLAIAPGKIDAAYRITNLSRSRDRELWVVESRFGPR